MKVYLCSDASGRHCWIRGASIDRIEDAGLEVLEDQSDDYDPGDYTGTMTLRQLFESDFIPFD